MGRAGVDAILAALSSDSTLHAIDLERGLTQLQALGRDKIILSAAFARKLRVGVGGSVRVRTILGTKVLEIGGIDDELMSSVAYVSLDTAEAWIPLRIPVFNKLLITVARGEARRVEAYLYTLPGAETVRIESSVLDSWDSLMGFYYLFMDIILAFAFVTAFAILFDTMSVNVREQERELATMRSIGAGGGRIALLMIAELLALWALALLPGFLLGAWAAREMGEAMQSDLFSIRVTVSPASCLASAAGFYW